ncbi:hypothetical protein ACHAW6_002729 [Cyclotella cf. meneghiniana]
MTFMLCDSSGDADTSGGWECFGYCVELCCVGIDGYRYGHDGISGRLYLCVVEERDEFGQLQQQHEEEQENQKSIWINPTAEKESAEGHSIVILVAEAMSSSSNKVSRIERPLQDLLTSFTYGAPMSMQGMLQCMESVGQCNTAAVAFMRMAVEHMVQQEVITLWS